MDLQPSLPASPFLLELGESEIMDMKIRGLLPVLSAFNILVLSLKKKEREREKLDGFVSEKSPVIVSGFLGFFVFWVFPLQNPVILTWEIENRTRF